MPLFDNLRRMLSNEGKGSKSAAKFPSCRGARTVEYLAKTGEFSLEARYLLDLILLDAIDVKASDVHLDPAEDHMLVRYRIDGMLHDVVKLPNHLKGPLANRVKVMADLKIYEHRVPQEGKAKADPAMGGFEMRVSLSPMVAGEKISIRLFRPGEQRFSVQSLGFDQDTLNQWVNLISQPHGLLLLTGPVGSGKTTTLYSTLTHLVNTQGQRLNITTVEDPVESVLPRVNQATVNVAQGFTYPIALRSILRHDPQVIMIGEIRDEETAGIAVRASLSGHLVLSTVHSGTAAGAFARMANLHVDPQLLASATIGVMNLRLVRQNCTQCAIPYEPGPMHMARLEGLDLDRAFFRKGTGCAACGFTGFQGRLPVTELLVKNPEIERLIATNAPSQQIHDLAEQHGMCSLAASAVLRAFAGETTMEEISGFLV
jgi:type IV pilus assembly protein PilB